MGTSVGSLTSRLKQQEIKGRLLSDGIALIAQKNRISTTTRGAFLAVLMDTWAVGSVREEMTRLAIVYSETAIGMVKEAVKAICDGDKDRHLAMHYRKIDPSHYYNEKFFAFHEACKDKYVASIETEWAKEVIIKIL